ncbi:MAG: hypothetical protein WC453_01855 [Patescibacteria group bacterium]
MTEIIQFLQKSVEVGNFGFNLTTASALLTIVLSTYQMWGVTQQIKTINRKRSAEMIIMPLFVFGFYYLYIALLYGLYAGRLAVVYNGLSTFFYLAMLMAAWRYQKMKPIDYLTLSLFSLMIPMMIMIPDKKSAYMSCAAVMLLGMLIQLIYVIVKKKKGVLETKLIDAYIVTNSSWLIYGILTRDWAFQISSAVGLSLLIPLSILLRKYKDS